MEKLRFWEEVREEKKVGGLELGEMGEWEERMVMGMVFDIDR